MNITLRYSTDGERRFSRLQTLMKAGSEKYQTGEYYYVPNGVYTYRITYSSSCNSQRETKIGTITVIR